MNRSDWGQRLRTLRRLARRLLLADGFQAEVAQVALAAVGRVQDVAGGPGTGEQRAPRTMPVRYGRRQGYRVSRSPSREVSDDAHPPPDDGGFRSVLAEDVDWEPFAAFPPSARLAVVVGHPPEPGPYMVRVRLPSGVKLMPHWHHEDRVYTVISGVFYIGLGAQFDAKSGEYVTQVTAVGPISLEYVNPSDDPRKK